MLSDVLVQQGRQLEGLVLKQEVGLGHAEGEPSYQLALHQGQAGKLGVVDEALSAEDGVINAATWKNTGSAGHHERLSPLKTTIEVPTHALLPFSTSQPSPNLVPPSVGDYSPPFLPNSSLENPDIGHPPGPTATKSWFPKLS